MSFFTEIQMQTNLPDQHVVKVTSTGSYDTFQAKQKGIINIVFEKNSYFYKNTLA